MSDESMPPPNPRSDSLDWAWALVVTAALVAYSTSLLGAFVVDDWVFLSDNPKLHPGRFAEFFTNGFWEFSTLGTEDDALYRPLFLTTLAVNKTLWGVRSPGYHAFALALHLANTFLVIHLAQRLTGRTGPGVRAASAVAGLVFAVHPVAAEAVSWISAASYLQATTLLLLSFGAFLRFRDTSDAHWLLAACAAYLGAALTLEIALAFPRFHGGGGLRRDARDRKASCRERV